jgi:hypothetical protein
MCVLIGLLHAWEFFLNRKPYNHQAQPPQAMEDESVGSASTQPCCSPFVTISVHEMYGTEPERDRKPTGKQAVRIPGTLSPLACEASLYTLQG